jgi:hypothetical protein
MIYGKADDMKHKKFGEGGSARKAKPKAAPRIMPLVKPAKGAPTRAPLKATAAEAAALERGNREQAREDREYEMVFKKKPMAKGGKVMKHASKAGNAMKKKSADTMGRAMVKKKAMGGKMYAKGGSVDGCATKGKTKTKMVKMAMGGMTGYKRGGKTC